MDAQEEFEKVGDYLQNRFQSATEVYPDKNKKTGKYTIHMHKKDGYTFRVEMTERVLEVYGAPFVIEQLEHWGPYPKEPCAVVVKTDGLEPIPWE